LAKIAQMPAQDVIDGYRGVLDFYTWCDLNIVRKWPKTPGRNRSAAVVAAQVPFTYINKLASTLSPSVIDAYKEMALGTGLTWKDYLCRLYINATINDYPEIST
jgi:hypothetical protein